MQGAIDNIAQTGENLGRVPLNYERWCVMEATNKASVRPQLSVFFQAIWNSGNGKVKTQVEMLSAGKISVEKFARNLFRREAEPDFLRFLQLFAEKDQSAIWLVVNVAKHEMDVSNAINDAKDLVLHFERSKLS